MPEREMIQMAHELMPDSGSYDRWSRLLVPIYRRIARSAARQAPPRASILDIGCGPGRLAIALASAIPGGTITGADLDPAMIARAAANAARRSPNGTSARPSFVAADVAALPFPDESFDLVVSTFSFHHWADPERGLAEIHRVLRPGGQALIWDIAGPLRRAETSRRGPDVVVTATPFGSLRIGGRWGIGPLVLARRYDLVRRRA